MSQKPVSNEKINKVILFFSSSTAGVYMIHEHPIVRRIIWNKLNLNCYPAIYAFGTAIMIFLVCTIIDKIAWKKCLKVVDRIQTKHFDEIIQSFFDDGKSPLSLPTKNEE